MTVAQVILYIVMENQHRKPHTSSLSLSGNSTACI
jgi:hypothetical protein